METAHVGPERLAAFLDHQLAPAAHDEVVAHFAECAGCRREMTAMRQLLKRRVKRPSWYVIAPVLVAAAATIAFVVTPRVNHVDRDSSSIRSAGGLTPVDRSEPISMISPADDAVLAERRALFVWRSIGASATYRLTLQDSTGGTVWAATAGDTAAVLPDSVRLAPGEYYWSVAARLPDARSAKTGVRRFLAR